MFSVGWIVLATVAGFCVGFYAGARFVIWLNKVHREDEERIDG